MMKPRIPVRQFSIYNLISYARDYRTIDTAYLRKRLMPGPGFSWNTSQGVAGKIIKLLEQNDAK